MPCIYRRGRGAQGEGAIMRQVRARRRVWLPHSVFGALVIGISVLGVGFLGFAVWIGVSYWAMFHNSP